MAGELLTPWPVWTWLERTPPPATGRWPTEAQRHAGERAHFLRVIAPDQIEVEHLNGTREVWPLADVREIRRP